MKIQPVIGYLNNNHKNVSSDFSQGLQLKTNTNIISSNNNVISGKYIAFKAQCSNSKEVLINDFLQEQVEPFLKMYKEDYDKNIQIYNNAEKTESLARGKRYEIRMKHFEDFNLSEVPFVKENLEKPLAYRENLKEYDYLEKHCGLFEKSDETKQFAKDIEEKMHIAHFDKYNHALHLYDKVNRDIHNGYASINSIIFPFEAKKDGLQKAKNLVLGNISSYCSAAMFKNNYEKALLETNQSFKKQKLDSIYEKIRFVKDEIGFYKAHSAEIKDRTKEAEKLLKENSFTQEEIDESYRKLDAMYEKTIRRNLGVLKEYFEKHPDLKSNKELQKKQDNLLKQQEYLNIKLWQHIQDDIKDFNSPEQIVKRTAEYQKRMRERGIDIRIADYQDDDLPF